MAFPVNLAAIQDSKYFTETQISNTVSGEMEGGYTHTRARTTRANRKKFTTGFTRISNFRKLELEAFFASRGNHTPFVYTHPVSGDSYTVRMKGDMVFKYTGNGDSVLWNITEIVLVEV